MVKEAKEYFLSYKVQVAYIIWLSECKIYINNLIESDFNLSNEIIINIYTLLNWLYKNKTMYILTTHFNWNYM